MFALVGSNKGQNQDARCCWLLARNVAHLLSIMLAACGTYRPSSLLILAQGLACCSLSSSWTTECTHVGHIQSKYNSYNSYNARAPGLNAQTNDAVTDAESQMLLLVEQVAAAHIACRVHARECAPSPIPSPTDPMPAAPSHTPERV